MVTQLDVITIVDSVSVSICPGDSFVVGNIIHQQAGVFNDTLTSTTGCDSVIIANISLKPAPGFAIMSSADSVDVGVAFELNCSNQQALSYYWYGQAQFSSADSFATTATLDTTQWLFLSVVNSSGCATIDSILIYTREIICDTCESSPDIFVPNVFTPNGDGVNDAFEILNLLNYDKRSITIYNRWGNEIYHAEKYNNNWSGSDQVAGTYYYELELFNGTKTSIKQGYVQLIK